MKVSVMQTEQAEEGSGDALEEGYLYAVLVRDKQDPRRWWSHYLRDAGRAEATREVERLKRDGNQLRVLRVKA